MNKWFDRESMFPSQDSFVSFLAIDFSKKDLFFAFKHNSLVTLNFSFMEIPTSFYEKSDQLIGFCVLELV